MTTTEDLDMITMDDIKQSLHQAEGKIKVFRPTAGAGFIQIDNALLNQAFDEISAKIPLVSAGLTEFTATEKIMLTLFIEHARFG